MSIEARVGMEEEALHAMILKAWDAKDPNLFIDSIPYCKFMGIRAVDAGEELPRFIMPYKNELVGNMVLPALHGGALGAFLEMSAIGGLLWAEKVRRVPKIINLTVSYLHSAGPKDCYSRVTITRQGRNMAAVQVMGWQDNEHKPFAQMIGHFLYED